jgi:hypothetical protein
VFPNVLLSPQDDSAEPTTAKATIAMTNPMVPGSEGVDSDWFFLRWFRSATTTQEASPLSAAETNAGSLSHDADWRREAVEP